MYTQTFWTCSVLSKWLSWPLWFQIPNNPLLRQELRVRTEGNINNKCCSATGIGRTSLLNCSPNPMKAQSCIPTPTSILISTPITKEQGSNFDQWAVHENRLLFYKAVQLASIGGLNQRFHFHTTFGVPENMDHRGMLLLTRARPKNKNVPTSAPTQP